MLAVLLPAKDSIFAAELQFAADAEQNLVYHLDCVTGLIGCNHPTFSENWETLPPMHDDKGWLERWRRSRTGMQTTRIRAEPKSSPSHPMDAAIFAEQRAPRVLSADDYLVLSRFRPRFDTWWQKRSNNHAERMKLGLESESDRIELQQLLSALASFHELPSDRDAAIEVLLISAPGPARSRTHAEVRGGQAFVETTIGENIAARLGVVSHEIAHHYYALTPTEKRQRTREWFLASGEAWSIAAYNLFNEAIASAFGNGLVESRMQADSQFQSYLSLPESFYADVYVDAAGKAALPLLRAYISEDRALDQAFVQSYISAVGESLQHRMTDIAFWLRSLAFTATSDSLAALVSTVDDHFVTGALFQETVIGGCGRPCLLNRYPELSGIIVTLNEDIAVLKEFLPADAVATVRRSAVVDGVAIYAHKRSDRSLLFVVSGATAVDVETGLHKLFSQRRIFRGLL